MPLLGVRDLSAEAETAPEMPSLDAEPTVIEHVEILQLLYEIDSPPMLDLLPPALHPTSPPLVTWIVWRASGGPLGPFTMAQTRIGSRAGVRPRGYLLSAVIDNPDAAAALTEQWGYNCVPGEVGLRRFHDRVEGWATLGGRTILEVALVDGEAISGSDIQYTASMHLARTPNGVRLVQVDPEYIFHRAERGDPHVTTFDAGAWGDPRIEPVWPVAASFAIADVTLPKLRYFCRTDVPAMQGTEKL